jgi:hypothetical protein
MAVVAQGSGPEAGSTAVDVPLVALDDFCRERNLWPDLLKVDVEGFEVEVLTGASECLKRVKRLALEFHNDDLRDRCLSILSGRFKIQTSGTLLFGEAGVA